MIYLVVSQSTHVRASLAPITGSTTTYCSLAVLLDLGQLLDCAIRSRPEQAYSRRGCVFVCLVRGGVCYMLDTLILTPSMRLFVPASGRTSSLPDTLEPSLTFFNQSLFQFLARFTALPTRCTGLPYRALPMEPHKVPLYTRLWPRSIALGSQRSPQSFF